jgi:hypothetical protein
MNGARIEGIIVGGPAYNSEQLNVGDVILEVNGRKVTTQFLHEGLFGVDIPGTKVIIKVQKNGQTREAEVVLIRMPAEQLAGRRRLFELLNKMKVALRNPRIFFHYSDSDPPPTIIPTIVCSQDRAKADDDSTLEEAAEDCLELWTRALVDDARSEQAARDGVLRLQHECFVMLKDLQRVLRDAQGRSIELLADRPCERDTLPARSACSSSLHGPPRLLLLPH